MRMRDSRSCSIDCWPTVAREVDALSKGKRKDKKGSSSFGKGKGQNSTWNVVCWNWQAWPLREGLRTSNGHRTKNGRKSKGKSKGKGKLRCAR